MNPLNVYFENRIVGRIEVNSEGPTFVYESTWLRTKGAFPISTTIPLSTTPVRAKIFVPWAANLLPEGGALRRVGELLHAAPEDVLKILLEIGRDTAGALSIGRPGTTDPGAYREIRGASELERIINELPRKPFLAGEDGVSMSLAGVQTKLGVRKLDNDQIAIPINGAPSTHILKPDSRDLYGSVQNEAFCLTLARLCGLNASNSTTGVAGQRQYLIIERYDRVHMQNKWRRIHQEDFCQALGKPPEAKYEKNQTGIKGPTALDMIAITRNTMKGPDTLAMLDYIVFNVAICNTDAHAKNYSALITAMGASLSPMYDVICTQVWDGITHNLAQSVSDQTRGDHIKRRHWERFAESAGFNSKSMIARIGSLLDRMDNRIPAARQAVAEMPAGDHTILDQVEATVSSRIARLRAGLSKGYADSEQLVIRGKKKEVPKSRESYLSAMRKATSASEFSKIVRRLAQDRNMKATDVRAIAQNVLDRRFTSKKAAMQALASASGAEQRLIS